MQVHQLLHERQSNTRSLVRSRQRTLHAMEAIKQSRQLFGCNAYTTVLYGQLRGAVDPPEAHGNATLEGVFERIRQQVENDFFPHLPIDIDRLAQRWAGDGQRQARGAGGAAKSS